MTPDGVMVCPDCFATLVYWEVGVFRAPYGLHGPRELIGTLTPKTKPWHHHAACGQYRPKDEIAS